MNTKTRDFIGKNLNADVRQLALKGCRDPEVDLDMALRQIAGHQTARRKLPSWAALDGILYPPHLNMEQCSSEQTARYKKSLTPSPSLGGEGSEYIHSIQNVRPTRLVDLTGGFGVDFALMSQAFDEAIYVERDTELFLIASANLKLLAPKGRCINGDAIETLHALDHATMIFMDPARRDSHGSRTYGIGDCTPNVLEIKDELLQKADIVMLKLSPMLDWHKAIRDLGEPYIKEVHIVSLHNECKELILMMSARRDSRDSRVKVVCTNILPDGSYELFQFSSPFSPLPSSISHLPSAYLYEPNASIMKAGCFAEVARAFNVSQLSTNSHLFTSDEQIPGFPGRKFRITAVSTMNRQELKRALRDIHEANITVRNFPMTVAQLRSKLKISEGGSDYIFATTLADGKHVLLVTLPLR